jgi:Protein of unknown function (DUF2612)
VSTIQDYQKLLTSEHWGKPKLAATIAACTAVPAQIQVLFDSMTALFDLDSPPVGDQLDIIGKWVGVSRALAIPLEDVFFSWDADASLGWDFGVWKDPNNPTVVLTDLPDDAYLTLIRAKIAANHWDGTTEGAYAVWSIIFPALNILIQDFQNMRFAVAIQGTILNTLTKALLTGGYLPLKPEGVEIINYILPIDTGPLFAWDVENAYLAGWDDGSWGKETVPT